MNIYVQLATDLTQDKINALSADQIKTPQCKKILTWILTNHKHEPVDQALLLKEMNKNLETILGKESKASSVSTIYQYYRKAMVDNNLLEVSTTKKSNSKDEKIAELEAKIAELEAMING
jgi:hypothetical protein